MKLLLSPLIILLCTALVLASSSSTKGGRPATVTLSILKDYLQSALSSAPSITIVGSKDPLADEDNTTAAVYHFNCDLPEDIQADLVDTIRHGKHQYVDIHFSGRCLGYFLMINLFHAQEDSVYRFYGPATIMTGGTHLPALRSHLEFYDLVFDHENWPGTLLAYPARPLRTSRDVIFDNCVFKNFGSPDYGGALWLAPLKGQPVESGAVLTMNRVSMTDIPKDAVVVSAMRHDITMDRVSCIRCGAPVMHLWWSDDTPLEQVKFTLRESTFSTDMSEGPTPAAGALSLHNVPAEDMANNIQRNKFFDYTTWLSFNSPPAQEVAAAKDEQKQK